MAGAISYVAAGAGTPLGVLAGAGLGALVARGIGRAALAGGAWGAIAGGLLLNAVLLWRVTPPGAPQLFAASVVACSGLGFLVGGPVGAIVGAMLASPVGLVAGRFMLKRWPDVFG